MTSTSRNRLGFICFFILALLIGILAEVVMIAREIYQWKHYRLSRFEWDDIIRYSIAIIPASTIHYLILSYLIQTI